MLERILNIPLPVIFLSLWTATSSFFCLLSHTKIVENIVSKPEETKFRELRASNKTISRAIMGCHGGREFLHLLGFEKWGEAGTGARGVGYGVLWILRFVPANLLARSHGFLVNSQERGKANQLLSAVLQSVLANVSWFTLRLQCIRRFSRAMVLMYAIGTSTVWTRVCATGLCVWQEQKNGVVRAFRALKWIQLFSNC